MFIEIQEAGKCEIPEPFASDMTALTVALDWARVFNGRGDQLGWTGARDELGAARTAALAIAAQCDELIERADEFIARHYTSAAA